MKLLWTERGDALAHGVEFMQLASPIELFEKRHQRFAILLLDPLGFTGVKIVHMPAQPSKTGFGGLNAMPTRSGRLRGMHPLADERRAEPRDDLLSTLLAAEEAGDRLTLDEVFRTCVLLLVAGNETTTNLIGNALLALLRNPDQMKLLRDDPSLMENAIEELLRYDSPVQATARIALEDFEMRGHPIRKGQQVSLKHVGSSCSSRM